MAAHIHIHIHISSSSPSAVINLPTESLHVDTPGAAGPTSRLVISYERAGNRDASQPTVPRSSTDDASMMPSDNTDLSMTQNEQLPTEKAVRSTDACLKRGEDQARPKLSPHRIPHIARPSMSRSSTRMVVPRPATPFRRSSRVNSPYRRPSWMLRSSNSRGGVFGGPASTYSHRPFGASSTRSTLFGGPTTATDRQSVHVPKHRALFVDDIPSFNSFGQASSFRGWRSGNAFGDALFGGVNSSAHRWNSENTESVDQSAVHPLSNWHPQTSMPPQDQVPSTVTHSGTDPARSAHSPPRERVTQSESEKLQDTGMDSRRERHGTGIDFTRAAGQLMAWTNLTKSLPTSPGDGPIVSSHLTESEYGEGPDTTDQSYRDLPSPLSPSQPSSPVQTSPHWYGPDMEFD